MRKDLILTIPLPAYFAIDIDIGTGKGITNDFKDLRFAQNYNIW